jgi:hypothetical protein
MAPYYLSIPPILGLQCPSKTIYTAFCEFAPPPPLKNQTQRDWARGQQQNKF